MPVWQIPVTSGCASTPGFGYVGNLVIDDMELGVGIARTILGYHVGSRFQDPLAWLSRGMLQLMVVWRDGPFTLRPKYAEIYRDFSANTRIGELAQGVAWCYFTQYGSFPFVIDFAGYLKKRYGVSCNATSTPDFILVDPHRRPPSSPVGLLEVKGTRNPKAKLQNLLKTALDQCDSGETLLAGQVPPTDVSSSWGAVLDLSDPVGSLYIDDPDGPALTPPDEALERLVRLSYVSWFVLLGMTEDAHKLIEGEPIGMLSSKRKILSGSMSGYALLPVSPEIASLFGSTAKERGVANFAIRLDVLNLLQTKEPIWQPLSKQLVFQNKQNKGLSDPRRSSTHRSRFTKFTDGTAVFVSS
jgi:hypothetical protein